jgi:hypothetical protein
MLGIRTPEQPSCRPSRPRNAGNSMPDWRVRRQAPWRTPPPRSRRERCPFAVRAARDGCVPSAVSAATIRARAARGRSSSAVAVERRDQPNVVTSSGSVTRTRSSSALVCATSSCIVSSPGPIRAKSPPRAAPVLGAPRAPRARARTRPCDCAGAPARSAAPPRVARGPPSSAGRRSRTAPRRAPRPCARASLHDVPHSRLPA